MKTIKTISLAAALIAGAAAIQAEDYLYFYSNGEVLYKLPAGNVERINMTADKKLQAVDVNSAELYSVAAAGIDSISFYAPMPKADLLDVVFNADGTAKDVSPMDMTVKGVGNPATEWSYEFDRYVTQISGNTWGNSNVANMFYEVDYSSNQAFMNALADGHTLEVLFKPNYSGALANAEAKIFASHETGGTGIMIKTKSKGPDANNSLTFLPNVSTTATSAWQWCSSGVVPATDEYYHIVGVWDKDAKKAYVYINGEKSYEMTVDGSNYIATKSGARRFAIGADPCIVSATKTTGAHNGINGTIVLARIYDDPLDEEQAHRLYQDVEDGVTGRKLAPMPKADLLDVVFNADGTAKDVSPMNFEVKGVGNPATEWSDGFNRYVTRISGNTWGNSNVAKMFYQVDYDSNAEFKNALADGHTLEVLFKPDYSTLSNVEAKIFASHESGGTGIMIKKTGSGPDTKNSLTFLPNVSATTKGSWQWCSSGVVPSPDQYYHIVGVWDKDSKKAYIYVNGSLSYEMSVSGSNYVSSIAGACRFVIGGDACVVTATKNTGAQNGINGTIVLARIYDDPLTAQQAYRLYQDVEEGIVNNKLMIEDVSLLENVMVKGGAVYPIKGVGFEEGDKIILSKGTTSSELPVVLDGADGVKVTLPVDVASGQYGFTLKRGDRTQNLGGATFKLVDNMEVKAQVVAHRGYFTKEGAAENSRASLRNAIELGCYGSETDIWLTADNRLVVNHDPSRNGVTLQTSNYDDVKNLKLSNGETLSTLEEFLEIMKTSNHCKLIIETKTHSTTERTIEAAMAAVEAVKKAGLEDMVEYIAFDYETCVALAKLEPKVKVQYLCDKASLVKTPQQLKDAGDINVDYKMTILSSNPTFVEEAHNLGLTVNVWTVTTNSEIGEWIMNGADFITGNAPDITKRYIEYYNANK